MAKKVWDVESMKVVLERNDDQVGKALVKLYEYQTAEEQRSENTCETNGVGFNRIDAELLSSFARAYQKYGRLTEKQLCAARKRIMKYIKQLVRIANHAEQVKTQFEEMDRRFAETLPEKYKGLVATPTSVEVHPGYVSRTYVL